MNDRGLIAAAVVSCALLTTHGAGLPRGERQYIWPDGRMPDAQPQLIAAMTEDSRAAGFKADDWRRPYVEWFAAPPKGRRTGVCVILISGGSYECCCDGWLLKDWLAYLTKLGVTCVNFGHRTPRANGLPFYQVAWEDGQRAVRVVRQAAAARGFDPAKIGVMSMSAGSHLATLLATTSLTPAWALAVKSRSYWAKSSWIMGPAPADGSASPSQTRHARASAPSGALNSCGQ